MNEADVLVLKWVETKLPQWFNEKIEQLSEYVERYENTPSRLSWQKELVVLQHLQNCPTKKVIAPVHGHECGCYSEYTRDDPWVVHAVVACSHYLCHEWHKSFGGHEVPEILEEIYELDESDCPWEDEDE